MASKATHYIPAMSPLSRFKNFRTPFDSYEPFVVCLAMIDDADARSRHREGVRFDSVSVLAAYNAALWVDAYYHDPRGW